MHQIFDGIDDDSYRIAPVDASSVGRLSHADHLLVTRYWAASGTGDVRDSVAADDRLIRRVACLDGRIRFRLRCEPRFGWGRDRHSTAITRDGATFRSPTVTLELRTRVPLVATAHGVTAEFDLAAGERATFVLSPLPS
jgi:hypothetical protein